ncbi:MAG: hypothetical protein SFW66_10110 [Gammaproteobacteria bacterium]|nr:hypothetical protein [Gammaproteobacteria bacterium]
MINLTISITGPETPDEKFNLIRKNIKNLDNPENDEISLSFIGLRIFTAEKICILLSDLPSRLTTINLSSHFLGGREINCIQLALSGLHHSPQVNTLILKNNRLGTFGRRDPENTFSNLSPTIMTLDISSNEYDLRSTFYISQLLSGLKHTSVKKLIMRHNGLGKRNFKELLEAFKDLPINELDISNNDFKLNAHELIELFDSLAYLDCIHFSGNNLEKLSEIEQATLIAYLKNKNNILINEEPYFSEILKKKKIYLTHSIDRFFYTSTKETAYFAEPNVIGLTNKFMSI